MRARLILTEQIQTAHQLMASRRRMFTLKHLVIVYMLTFQRFIFDITDLEKPVNTGYYKSKTRSVDHNQFVYDGLAYQSNYQAGLRVLDVSTIPEDDSGDSVEEIAFFDVYPGDDDEEGGGVADW